MKKLIMLAIALMCLTLSVSAANGDIAGKIYSTDIRAFINGVEVESCNIGGKTAVVIEDILKVHTLSYDDSTRTLKATSFAPDHLIAGKNNSTQRPGTIIGNIYETDIVTSIYGIALPSFNIGGKTAVVIEDLGGNREFSEIGGKFIWDDTNRTISLEFMYDNSAGLISKDRIVYVKTDAALTQCEAVVEDVVHCGGGYEVFDYPSAWTEAPALKAVFPIKARDEIIGYRLRVGEHSFSYYYPEKLKQAEAAYTPCAKSRESVVAHFRLHHSVAPPIVQLETEEYTFVYNLVAMVSSVQFNLLQVYNDGSYIDYAPMIYAVYSYPVDLVVDEENEIVTFRLENRYDANIYTDYEIDLKAGVITAK